MGQIVIRTDGGELEDDDVHQVAPVQPSSVASLAAATGELSGASGCNFTNPLSFAMRFAVSLRGFG